MVPAVRFGLCPHSLKHDAGKRPRVGRPCLRCQGPCLPCLARVDSCPGGDTGGKVRLAASCIHLNGPSHAAALSKSSLHDTTWKPSRLFLCFHLDLIPFRSFLASADGPHRSTAARVLSLEVRCSLHLIRSRSSRCHVLRRQYTRHILQSPQARHLDIAIVAAI